MAEHEARERPAPARAQAEIKPLTGIRGVAAFLVMLYHYSTNAAFPAFHVAWLHKGYLCVDLFFVLSGFALALRYGETFKGGWAQSHYGSFLQARVARLLPAYVAITLLYYAKWLVNMSGTNTASYGVQDFIANALLVQSWGFPVRPIISDSWSVSVECFAYLVFPLLVFCALGRRRITAIGLAVGAAGLLAFIASTGYGVNGPLDAYRDDNSLLPLLRCLAGFSLGLVAFRVTQMPACRAALVAQAMPAVILDLLVIALCLDRTDLFVVFLFPPLVACLSFEGRVSSALFSNKLIHHLGEISYSLYLLHPFFVGVAGRFASLARARFGIEHPVAFVAFGIVTTWLAAYLSYRYIELPGRRWLRRLGGPRSVAATP